MESARKSKNILKSGQVSFNSQCTTHSTKCGKMEFLKKKISWLATYSRNSNKKHFILNRHGPRNKRPKILRPKNRGKQDLALLKNFASWPKNFFYAFLSGTIRRLNKKKVFEILISKIFQEGQISGFLDPTLKNHNKKVYHLKFRFTLDSEGQRMEL